MVLLSQVISADTGCGKMLGFLPRELAQYLSPLIEKFCLSFEVIYFLNWKESCYRNFYASLFNFSSIWERLLYYMKSKATRGVLS